MCDGGDAASYYLVVQRVSGAHCGMVARTQFHVLEVAMAPVHSEVLEWSGMLPHFHGHPLLGVLVEGHYWWDAPFFLQIQGVGLAGAHLNIRTFAA